MSHNPLSHNYPQNNETSARRHVPGEHGYDPNSAQTGANWNQASSVAGNQPHLHGRVGDATGHHVGNFTDAHVNPAGHQGARPHNAGPTSLDYNGGGQNHQQPSHGMMGGAVGGVGHTSAGLPHGHGTGAPGVGAGAGTHQFDNNYSHAGAPGNMGTTAGLAGTTAKPSVTSRVVGEVEKIAGELTKNPGLQERGEVRKSGGTNTTMGGGTSGRQL